MSEITISINGAQMTGKSVILSRIYDMLVAAGYTSIDTDGSESLFASSENAIPYRDVSIFLQSDNTEIEKEEKEPFSYSEISDLTEAYWLAMSEERHCMKNIIKAREAVEIERLRVSRIAANTPNVATGKTKDERAEQVSEYIASDDELSNGLYWLEKYLADCEHDLDMAEIHRKALEAEISLTKAWLYSQSGVGK